jgi:hypothetical protein
VVAPVPITAAKRANRPLAEGESDHHRRAGSATTGAGARLRAAGRLLSHDPGQLLAQPAADLSRHLTRVDLGRHAIQPAYGPAYRRLYAGRVRWQPASGGVSASTGRSSALSARSDLPDADVERGGRCGASSLQPGMRRVSMGRRRKPHSRRRSRRYPRCRSNWNKRAICLRH